MRSCSAILFAASICLFSACIKVPKNTATDTDLSFDMKASDMPSDMNVDQDMSVDMLDMPTDMGCVGRCDNDGACGKTVDYDKCSQLVNVTGETCTNSHIQAVTNRQCGASSCEIPDEQSLCCTDVKHGGVSIDINPLLTTTSSLVPTYDDGHLGGDASFVSAIIKSDGDLIGLLIVDDAGNYLETVDLPFAESYVTSRVSLIRSPSQDGYILTYGVKKTDSLKIEIQQRHLNKSFKSNGDPVSVFLSEALTPQHFEVAIIDFNVHASSTKTWTAIMFGRAMSVFDVNVCAVAKDGSIASKSSCTTVSNGFQVNQVEQKFSQKYSPVSIVAHDGSAYVAWLHSTDPTDSEQTTVNVLRQVHVDEQALEPGDVHLYTVSGQLNSMRRQNRAVLYNAPDVDAVVQYPALMAPLTNQTGLGLFAFDADATTTDPIYKIAQSINTLSSMDLLTTADGQMIATWHEDESNQENGKFQVTGFDANDMSANTPPVTETRIDSLKYNTTAEIHLARKGYNVMAVQAFESNLVFTPLGWNGGFVCYQKPVE